MENPQGTLRLALLMTVKLLEKRNQRGGVFYRNVGAIRYLLKYAFVGFGTRRGAYARASRDNSPPHGRGGRCDLLPGCPHRGLLHDFMRRIELAPTRSIPPFFRNDFFCGGFGGSRFRR